ncbi:DUF2569 domain-containing protein [Inediibacterium massiliense]|uniref:DUF2569 domain-containing protein n=1 Tax=Inediibacterium massiliense TaxID=1658111 RepID=UPI0006B40DC6|nr:DUF2569 domain-containing protein [Inediibacterium massiliense]
MTIDNKTELLEYSGIGGWLLLFTITAIIRPIYMAYETYSTFSTSLTEDTWYALTSPSSPVYHVLWKPTIIFELVANIISVLLALTALFLLFKKSRFFIKMWSFSVIMSILFMVIDMILCNQIPALGNETFEVLVQNLFKNIGYLTIWGTYLLKSQRVKNTFIR